jgi:hypothetical protein
MEEAEQLLRDVVFAQWRASQCESHADTLKLMSLIDAFLPYLPLERQHMPALVQLGLRQRAALLALQRVALEWQPAVVGALASKVVRRAVPGAGGRGTGWPTGNKLRRRLWPAAVLGAADTAVCVLCLAAHRCSLRGRTPWMVPRWWRRP